MTVVLCRNDCHCGQFSSAGVSISNDGMKFVAANPGRQFPADFTDCGGTEYLFVFAYGKWTAPQPSDGSVITSADTAWGKWTGLVLSPDDVE
ncbi:MAG: hypothetical protein ACRETQ_01515 [Gammaproteobacteria bacterium]